MRLSIRWRLTIWNTLALAVVLLGFAALVYGLTRRALYEQLDRRLSGGFEQMAQDRRLTSAPDDARWRYWVYELYEHENLFCVIYGADGKIRERTEQLAAESVPPGPRSASDGPNVENTELPIVGRQRVFESRLRAGEQDFQVVLMAPLAEMDRELATLRTASAIAVPVALLLSGGVGYLLARKALAPIERLRRSTQEITAEHLDRRLPVPNPGDELGGLAATINEMIARLERSFAEIRRFTADASHELRTPLTVIRTEAEVALRKPSGSVDYQNLLGSILEECERLTRLTDQLLTLSREDAGMGLQARESVDLTALLRGVMDTMRPLAEMKGLSFRDELRDTLRVRGDGARLRQVFYNLLDNALKYTTEGGAVDLRGERRDRSAVVTVRDTGIGIPAEDLPHVFDRFYRVDKARSRAQGGTGLGLSIARSIVTAHGGQIELQSRPGQGTTCLVTLPLDPDG